MAKASSLENLTNSSGQVPVSVDAGSVTLTTGDIEIGAVEIKNATTDTRAVVLAASTASQATDTPLVVALHPSSPLGAGTAAIGKLAANAGVTIGAVEVAAAQTLGTVTTVSTVTALTGGGVAHDGADTGNPHKVGFKAYSPDGTTPGTAVAEADRTDAKADLDGRLYVNTVSPVLWSYHENSSSALTDAAVKASPGAGFAIFVTDIVFSTGAATACNIFFEEGASTVLGPWYLEATAGRGLALHFTTPKMITASTALTVTTSAAIAHGLDVTGYVAAV